MDAYERTAVLVEYARSLADRSRRHAERADTLAREAQRVFTVAEQLRSSLDLPRGQPAAGAER
jgi:hypothetical protein